MVRRTAVAIAVPALLLAVATGIVVGSGNGGSPPVAATSPPPAVSHVGSPATGSTATIQPATALLRQITTDELATRPVVAGIRLVPVGTAARWDEAFEPQVNVDRDAGWEIAYNPVRLREVGAPFLDIPSPGGFTTGDGGGVGIRTDPGAAPLVVGGGFAFTDAPDRHLIRVEYHRVRPGDTVEETAYGNVFVYTTMSGASAIIRGYSPFAGAQPALDAILMIGPYYIRIDATGNPVAPLLELLDTITDPANVPTR